MGEDVEGGVGGEPTEESAPKLEEMTPEQQEVHNTATKREAEDISDEIKESEAAINFAKSKGLDAERVKENIIEAKHAEGLEENKIEDYARQYAQTAIEAMATAKAQRERCSVEVNYDFSASPMGSKIVDRAEEILEAEKGGPTENGYRVSTPIGRYFFRRGDLKMEGENNGMVRQYFIEGLPD